MGLSRKQIRNAEDVIKSSIRNKLKNYNPEPAEMPFHTRLLGKDRLALYKFIHSLNTSFGTKIFEPVALALAQEKFVKAKSQQVVGRRISQAAQAEIQRIMDDLGVSVAEPNKPEEIERIRKVAREGDMVNVKLTKIDLMVESKQGKSFLFDIKTAKPNIGNFKEFKRTLLEWVAVTLAESPETDVNTLIAIPYNPYAPEPYQRWTVRGLLDSEHELKVAEEFWNFLGGENSYDNLLDCFERVGVELREEIDEYFARFKND